MPKKTSSRKAKNSKRSKVMPLTPVPPLAGTRRARMVFCSTVRLTEPAISAGAYNFYRLNAPYDPDTAVLSLSTPGLAAIAQLYNGMRVHRTTMEVDGNVSSSDASAGLWCAMVTLVPTAFQPVLPSNPNYWPVQRLAVSKPVKVTGGAGTRVYTGCVSVKGSWSINDVLNVTRAQYVDEADFASTTVTNPTRQAYVAICLNGSGVSGLALDGFFTIRIAYDIEFFSPFPLQ